MSPTPPGLGQFSKKKWVFFKASIKSGGWRLLRISRYRFYANFSPDNNLLTRWRHWSQWQEGILLFFNEIERQETTNSLHHEGKKRLELKSTNRTSIGPLPNCDQIGDYMRILIGKLWLWLVVYRLGLLLRTQYDYKDYQLDHSLYLKLFKSVIDNIWHTTLVQKWKRDLTLDWAGLGLRLVNIHWHLKSAFTQNRQSKYFHW